MCETGCKDLALRATRPSVQSSARRSMTIAKLVRTQSAWWPFSSNKPAAPKKAVATKADDLKKVEGIGPKIAETLIAAGISTFAELAKAKPAKIAEMIADVRGNHVTDTWPAQAKLATDGKWDELKKWQDELDGGKA